MRLYITTIAQEHAGVAHQEPREEQFRDTVLAAAPSFIVVLVQHKYAKPRLRMTHANTSINHSDAILAQPVVDGTGATNVK